ncbi:thermonuclease family protein [Haloechinothrix halophila]|uniref:thermonuclease family protein n=1 Tax=Haloechinothrix halophila TaxID=1069073 RepID=UPI000403B198|nr:thermonuclease family protein [Haloechinothrix halophila]
MLTRTKRMAMAGCAAALLTVSLAPSALAETSYTDRKVEYVNDGDTLQFYPPISGSKSVRFLNIDSPEMDGDTQEPWATESRDHLRGLLPQHTPITITTDVEEKDIYDRVLGHVTRDSDRLNTNREQLRMGHAVTYVIWPNQAHFEDYRTAQKEAQDNGRGIWDPADPLTELPFEYRLRVNERVPDKPVGDWFTKKYVDPADYDEVHVNNRIFFWNESDAQEAGFSKCPQDSSGNYDSSCFSAG